MLMLALIVPALAYGVLRIEGPRIREEALANLAAIGRLKTEQIEVWLNERHGDAAMLMASEGFVDDAQSWLDRRDSVANERISRRLAALRRTHAYRDVELLDPRKPAPAMSASRKDLLAAAIASGRAQTSDLYRDPSGAIWLEFLAADQTHALGSESRGGGGAAYLVERLYVPPHPELANGQPKRGDFAGPA